MPLIFIDLEETVIREFKDFPIFMTANCQAIKQFIHNVKKEDFGTLKIYVFSFAIHTDKDIDRFDQLIRDDLNRLIGHKIDDVVTVPQMFIASQQQQHCHFDDITDFILMRGKEGAFQDWCDYNFKSKHCMLIDDVVRNMSIINHDTLVTMTMFNINTVREEYEKRGF